MEKVSSILGAIGTQQRAAARASSPARVQPEALVPASVGALNDDGVAPNNATVDRPKREYYPRRKRTGPPTDLTRIKGILSRVLAHRGLDKKVERYAFILHWRSIVGEKLAEVTRPDCIRNKTLFVNVVHSVWAQELAFMKPMLLQKLSHYLRPGDIVTDIAFRIGHFEGN